MQKKYTEALEIARKWKPYRRHSIKLSREIARAESGARFWLEAAESWKFVCESAVVQKRKDWLQLVKAQNISGLCDEVIGTLQKMQKRFPGDDLEPLLQRLQKQQIAYERVDQQVLAYRPSAYKITYYKNKEPSSTVVVTFGIIYSGLSFTPFGFPFITHQEYDHIHVAQEPFTFYQLLDLDVFLAAVRDICHGKNVVAYGSSLGAYAAFYYGGPLGAKILTASPRNSVDDCITRISKHWRHVPWRHGKIANNATSVATPIIFWDPIADKRDKVYLRERILPAYPNVELISIPHGGHSTFRYLSERKLLKEILVSVVKGDFSGQKIRDTLGLPLADEDTWNLDSSRISGKVASVETKDPV